MNQREAASQTEEVQKFCLQWTARETRAHVEKNRHPSAWRGGRTEITYMQGDGWRLSSPQIHGSSAFLQTRPRDLLSLHLTCCDECEDVRRRHIRNLSRKTIFTSVSQKTKELGNEKHSQITNRCKTYKRTDHPTPKNPHVSPHPEQSGGLWESVWVLVH